LVNIIPNPLLKVLIYIILLSKQINRINIPEGIYRETSVLYNKIANGG
jgi:hypothetical protein